MLAASRLARLHWRQQRREPVQAPVPGTGFRRI